MTLQEQIFEQYAYTLDCLADEAETKDSEARSRLLRVCANGMRDAQKIVARDWHPIETAPHDKRVIVWSGREMYCAHWAKNPYTGDEAWIVAEWENDQALVKPTHWQALPLPPNAPVQAAPRSVVAPETDSWA